jgi:hypothetical protein
MINNDVINFTRDYQYEIGRMLFSHDQENLEHSYDLLFSLHCQSAIEWCNVNYPDQIIYTRHFEPRKNLDYSVLAWYAVFPDQSSLLHFILSR